MALEIDMLSVGNGDAIIIRTSDNTNEHVVLIDAGHHSDGETVINHIEKWTTRKDVIDLLISTHPHDDHIGGLLEVLDKMKVQEVLIHDPNTFQEQIKSLKSIATREQTERAKKSLDSLNKVIDKIDCKGIPCKQPFTGVEYELLDGATLTIVGPTEEFYTNLAPQIKSRQEQTTTYSRSDAEVVDENDDASPFNNSCVITLLTYKGSKYLFTADAGPKSFDSVIECSSEDLSNVHWMQIPHHGSKSNITSELIDYFSPEVAYVSAKGGDGIHPSPEVVRLFQKQGCKVYGTFKDGSLRHRNGNAPDRERYVTADPLNSNAE